MYQVNECFCSIQGESSYAGHAAVFVRMAGCDLRCPFCDTDHDSASGEHGGKYQAEEIVALVLRIWGKAIEHSSPLVVLTGGEPTLQLAKDHSLLRALLEADCRVHVETNGTVDPGWDVPGVPRPTWITLSPKPGGKVRLPYFDEVKLLYPLDDPGLHPDRWVGTDAIHHWLQPVDNGTKEGLALATDLALSYVLSDPRWRLSVQVHKYIGAR